MYSQGSEQSDTSTHCTKSGIMKVAIRTFDFDVVIISIGHFHDFHIEQFWISFGVGNHNCHTPVHAVANSLLAEKSKAMMIFHAISGCDTVSSFLGKGKKSAWSAWTDCPAVTGAFTTLSSQPEEVDPQSMTGIQRCTTIMHSRTCTLSRVDEARKQLFTQAYLSTIENILQTKAVFLQHVKRVVYKAGYLWSQALVPAPDMPSPRAMEMDCDWLRMEAILDRSTRSIKVLLWAGALWVQEGMQTPVQMSHGRPSMHSSCRGHVATPDFNWGILKLR